MTELAEAMDLRSDVAAEVYERIHRKLDAEAVEDLRIDFEDGYGVRPDEDEDAATVGAARALAASIAAGDAAPFHGIRVKSLEAPTRRRGVRTLELFVRTLVDAGGLTDGFLVTLPKVTSVEQVDAFVFALGKSRGVVLARAPARSISKSRWRPPRRSSVPTAPRSLHA